MTIATESPQLERLKAVLSEIADLSHAQQILEWDARVSMPRAGAKARADVASILTQLAHGRFVSDEVGTLLAELDAAGHDPESVEGALIRVTRRDWERASRISSDGGIYVETKDKPNITDTQTCAFQFDEPKMTITWQHRT